MTSEEEKWGEVLGVVGDLELLGNLIKAKWAVAEIFTGEDPIIAPTCTDEEIAQKLMAFRMRRAIESDDYAFMGAKLLLNVTELWVEELKRLVNESAEESMARSIGGRHESES